jgi:hypothetical protein
MKKALLLLIWLILVLTKTTNAQSITEDQAKFLKWYIPNRGMATLVDETTPFFREETLSLMDSILTIAKFSVKDRQHIKTQVQLLKITKLDSLLSKQVTYPNEPGERSYISLPIFSLNGKIAFIRYKFVCGPRCGTGGIEAYERVETEKWKPYPKKLYFPFYVTTSNYTMKSIRRAPN